MPDWITHILVAWTSCKLLSFKYKQFNAENTIIVMIGSLIPDIFKIYIPLEFLGFYIQDFIMPIHLPLGSLIIASIISLFFKEKKIIFMFLVFGVFTHFALDLLLTYVSGGILLLFPFSWQTWQLRIIPVDDYYTMILAVFLAIIVYLISRKKDHSV